MIKLKCFYYFVTRIAFPKNCVQKTISIFFYKQPTLLQATPGWICYKNKTTAQQLWVWTFGIGKLFAFVIRIIVEKTRSPRLQGLTFCVVTVNDEHTKRRFKLKSRIKYKRRHMCQIVFKSLIWKWLVFL